MATDIEEASTRANSAAGLDLNMPELSSFTRRLPAAVFIAALSLPSMPAGAAESAAEGLAELPLESLLDMPVTGASRFTQRRSQVAAAVTVITREEIAGFGYRTLAEALAGVRGAVVSTDRTYHYLGVRGFLASGDYNTRVLLLVDGNRVNDAMYDQAVIGSEFPLDLDQVERIEFIPGQGSALYGANALYAVVNVVTREAPRQRSVAAGASFGSAGERGAHAALRLPWDNGGLQLQASRLRADGEALFDAGHAGVDGSDGWSHGTDSTQRDAVYLRADHGLWTLSLMHASRRQGLPMAIDVIYGDPRSQYTDTTTLLNVEGALPLSATARLTTRLYAGRYRFTGDYAMDYPPPTLNRDEALAAWRGVEARITQTGWAGHRVTAGVDAQTATPLEQRNFDVTPERPVYLDDRRSARRSALYAEDQWSFADGWELHLGARADRAEQGSDGRDWQLSPRAGLLWTPDPGLSLRLLHGTAFRPPNVYESHYAVDAPAGYSTNAALRTERVSGTELALDWRPQPLWRLSGSLYRNRTSRLILLGYDPEADRYSFANAGALQSEGGELEAEWAQSSIRWRANYSWVRTTGSVSGGDYPRRMLKGSAMLPLGETWTLGLQAQALSRRGAAPGLGLLDATLGGRLGEHGPRWTFAVRNLADRQAFDPGADPLRQPVVPLPRRQARIELQWQGGW